MGDGMLSVGLISKSKNIDFIKELNNSHIIKAFNIKNKEELLNQKFEILVVEDMAIDKENIKKAINKTEYLIIQDNINDLELNLDKEINIITFGFNHKSTVTVSSVTEENIVICTQRIIKSINHKLIQPQEIIIKNTNKYNTNKYIIKKIIEEIIEN